MAKTSQNGEYLPPVLNSTRKTQNNKLTDDAEIRNCSFLIIAQVNRSTYNKGNAILVSEVLRLSNMSTQSIAYYKGFCCTNSRRPTTAPGLKMVPGDKTALAPILLPSPISAPNFTTPVSFLAPARVIKMRLSFLSL